MEDLLSYNQKFVEEKRYESYQAEKYPAKKLAILTCMDARLTTMLPAALGLSNGDAIIIKNAGALVHGETGGEMHSLLVAIYELGVTRVLVVGHTDCGVQGMTPEHIRRDMEKRIGKGQNWEEAQQLLNRMENALYGFQQVEQSVEDTVAFLRRHPFIPGDIELYGMVIDSVTGKLTPVCEEKGQEKRVQEGESVR